MFGLKFIREGEWTKLREEMTLAKRQLEDIGWINTSSIGNTMDMMFTIPFKQMLRQCKVYYYKNPLAGLWVHLTTDFVFGEGVGKPTAKDPKIQEIVDEFWDDIDNQKTLTSFMAQQLMSNKVQYEGNIFLVLFSDELGKTKVRVMSTEEIDDIIYDPDDRMRPDFYKVLLTEKKYNYASHGYTMINPKPEYYPSPENFDPMSYGILPQNLRNDAVIMHFKINCDILDKYGVPELYRGNDWVQAHKNMAEDLATLVKALSKFAFKKKIKGSTAQVRSIADAMRSRTDLRNLSTVAGQTQIENEGVDLQSIDIKTGGIKVGTDGMRQMKLMVCAASRIFEHYYGDPSTGNLATAKTMELPMVKKFSSYQKLWSDIYLAVLNYVIDRKIEIGELEGKEEIDTKNKRRKWVTTIDRTIDIDFPPLLEEDLKVWADALSIAKDKGLIGEELASRLFMGAANVNNVDEEVEKALAENLEKKKLEQEQFKMSNPLSSEFGGKKPVKEAIETPAKKINLRSIRKENYALQKMNGYRKAIAGHWRRFLKETRNEVKTSGPEGQIVGDVKNFNRSLGAFVENMKEEARTYYPIAVEIGEKFMQANLKDLFPEIKLEATLYEARGRAKEVLNKRINWNDRYISASLEPAIQESFQKAIRKTYKTPAEFRVAINEAMSSFESRLEQYVGAFWTVEQEAVKESGRGTGVLVNFVGPDDSHDCEGCSEAVNGGPYNIEDAPLPGEQECLGRCRHALQVVESSKLNESYQSAGDNFEKEVKLKEGSDADE